MSSPRRPPIRFPPQVSAGPTITPPEPLRQGWLELMNETGLIVLWLPDAEQRPRSWSAAESWELVCPWALPTFEPTPPELSDRHAPGVRCGEVKLAGGWWNEGLLVAWGGRLAPEGPEAPAGGRFEGREGSGRGGEGGELTVVMTKSKAWRRGSRQEGRTPTW